jgi:hypothetical protein
MKVNDIYRLMSDRVVVQDTYPGMTYQVQQQRYKQDLQDLFPLCRRHRQGTCRHFEVACVVRQGVPMYACLLLMTAWTVVS